MTLPFDEAMARIAEVEKTLSISQYVDFDNENDVLRTKTELIRVKRVYTYFPAANHTITDFPCFINQWEETDTEYHSGGWISASATCHMQLFAGPAMANADIRAAQATAFYPKVLTAFAALKLGGWQPITIRSLRSGAIPSILEYAGVGYVGLDLFLDIYLQKAQVLTP